MSKRVCCLYRVSTGKQVDYDSNNEADIPMQRKACHKFASEMGWDIVHEEQEDGVSGHKIRAENRDKIQIIKDLARKKKFDILLVFMFASMAGMLPNLTLTTKTAMIPIVNVALFIKSIFELQFDWANIILVFISNVVYSIAAVMLMSKLCQKQYCCGVPY